jgi:hypothetical protein
MSVVTCWSLVSGSCNARDLQPSVMASADTLAALVPPNPYRLALEAFNHHSTTYKIISCVKKQHETKAVASGGRLR